MNHDKEYYTVCSRLAELIDIFSFCRIRVVPPDGYENLTLQNSRSPLTRCCNHVTFSCRVIKGAVTKIIPLVDLLFIPGFASRISKIRRAAGIDLLYCGVKVGILPTNLAQNKMVQKTLHIA